MRLKLFGWAFEIWVESFCEHISLLPEWRVNVLNEQVAQWFGWQRDGWFGWLFITFSWCAGRNSWYAERQRRRNPPPR